jgi:hypothetical protein
MPRRTSIRLEDGGRCPPYAYYAYAYYWRPLKKNRRVSGLWDLGSNI